MANGKRNGNGKPKEPLPDNLDKIITDLKLEVNFVIDGVGKAMDVAVAAVEELKQQRVLTKRLTLALDPFMAEIDNQLINARSREGEGFKFWRVQDALDKAKALVKDIIQSEQLLARQRDAKAPVDIAGLSEEEVAQLFEVKSGEVQLKDPESSLIIPNEPEWLERIKARILQKSERTDVKE